MVVVDNNGTMATQSVPVNHWSELSGNVYRSSGRVGIGKSNPRTNLDLYGNGTSGFALGGTTAVPNPAEGPEIGFGRGGFGNPGATIQMIDYDSYSAGLAFIVSRGVANSAGGVFADNFPSDAIQALTIVNTGNIGVGTSNPLAKLHVSGDVRVSNLAGSGTRMVVADSNGTLSTQSLPSSGSTPTTVKSGSSQNINPASYNAGSVSGMSISNVPAGSYVVHFNADMSRNGSSSCECIVRAGGSYDSDTERELQLPSSGSAQFYLMGRVTLSSTGMIEIRCRKSSGGSGFTVGKRAMSIQATN